MKNSHAATEDSVLPQGRVVASKKEGKEGGRQEKDGKGKQRGKKFVTLICGVEKKFLPFTVNGNIDLYKSGLEGKLSQGIRFM